jgi:hypothetical protein
MSKVGKPRPRTGEKRRTNLPLKIDRLPLEIRDAIQYLKNGCGKTWQEIEELSALPYNADWKSGKGGFVNWKSLPTPVLELFPDLRLPHSNLHRWYDLRVSQVTQETLRRAGQARAIAEGFAKSVVENGDEAVLNAARDQIMSILAEDASPEGRMRAAKALIGLGVVLQEARLNTIKERQVAVDERKIQVIEQRERIARQKLEAETEKAAKKLKTGDLTVEDINRLRERVFGLPPLGAEAERHG